MSNGMKPVRRIVTIDDEEGKSLAMADGPSPDVRSDPARPGFSSARIWVTDASPARIGEYRDTKSQHFFPPWVHQAHRPIRQQRRILTCRKPRHSTSVLSWKARSRWCSIPRKFILKSVILSCSEAPTTPGAIARTDPAGLPFHHMMADNDGKILIADRHTHRFCSIPAGTGLERRQRADVV